MEASSMRTRKKEECLSLRNDLFSNNNEVIGMEDNNGLCEEWIYD
jgi:hypothetical protein